MVQDQRSSNPGVLVQFVIPVLTAIAAASATVAVSHYFENKELSVAQTKIDRLTQENDHLNQELRFLRQDKDQSSKRPISYQLDRLRSYLDTSNREQNRQPPVKILGMNALGPIHHGKRVLSELLERGGHLHVLLLDPASEAWEKRLIHEHDTLQYNTAEMLAAFYGLLEIKNRPTSGKGLLEVRMHTKTPDRSLIIVDRNDSSGFVMGNRYPSTNCTEGSEGGAYTEPVQTARGMDDLKHFDELWGHAVPIILQSEPFTTRQWPFTRLSPPDGIPLH